MPSTPSRRQPPDRPQSSQPSSSSRKRKAQHENDKSVPHPVIRGTSSASNPRLATTSRRLFRKQTEVEAPLPVINLPITIDLSDDSDDTLDAIIPHDRMNIAVFNVPPSASRKELETFFTPLLISNGVDKHSFDVKKPRSKAMAFIQIDGKPQAEQFMKAAKFAERTAAWRFPPSRWALKFEMSHRQHTGDRPVKVRELEKQLDEQHFTPQLMTDAMRPALLLANETRSRFTFYSMSCGAFGYSGNDCTFTPYYDSDRAGMLNCGKHGLMICLGGSSSFLDFEKFIDYPYHWLDCVVLDKSTTRPCIYISGTMAPRMMKAPGPLDGRNKFRIPSIDPLHGLIAGECFVYRLNLTTRDDADAVQQYFDTSSTFELSEHFIMNVEPRVPFQFAKAKLQRALSEEQGLLWSIKFQVLKMARNGRLSPQLALALLPVVRELYEDEDEPETVIEALRSFVDTIPYPGPHVAASEFDLRDLATRLRSLARSHQKNGRHAIAKSHKHIYLTHHVRITPAGAYFEGPELETSNRVVRRYKDYRDVFIRVDFSEEDGGRIEYQRDTKLDIIYLERFKDFLTGSINICGKPFSFLGFSGSSLKGHSAWFSAPIHDPLTNTLRSGQDIIEELGDFSHIRSPAKCAARIGQAFTDSTGWYSVEPGAQCIIPDIEVNTAGMTRVFSDGCGTVSLETIQEIWDRYPRFFMRMKPTVIQIRYGGSKGLVSLDPALEGHKICIRPSMLKFEARGASDIEVCGMADRPLPLYLNRPLIKILEDLGVPDQSFMELQDEYIAEFKEATQDADEFAKFMTQENMSVGDAAGFIRLYRKLDFLKFNFRKDAFLSQFVDAAVMIKLREVKYRGRIKVEKGVKLFGIMDETGFLKEGQIYVTIERPGEGRTILCNEDNPSKPVSVGISRSPALHPGDVQLVKAVDVPDDSPLNMLRNVVVFSQHGTRDLASMLGGGDLDGDQFDVFFDPRLLPRKTYVAADYPRVDPVKLDREVTLDDMAEFFVQFMENDRLSMLATLHLQLADRLPGGVTAPICIYLAELCSRAVDYQKSGIYVKHSDIPRIEGRNLKPDFMVPSPTISITNDDIDLLMHELPVEDAYNALLGGPSETRYYQSQRILGKLFRRINDKTFFTTRDTGARSNLLKDLWQYIDKATATIQWRHHGTEAINIRTTYEDNLISLAHQYAFGAKHPLLELEVLLGTTFGATTKRHRDIAREMREKFERDVIYTRDCIKGDAGDVEGLPRAIACFYFGMRDGGMEVAKGRPVVSFKYVAVGVCLEEMEKWYKKGPPR